MVARRSAWGQAAPGAAARLKRGAPEGRRSMRYLGLGRSGAGRCVFVVVVGGAGRANAAVTESIDGHSWLFEFGGLGSEPVGAAVCALRPPLHSACTEHPPGMLAHGSGGNQWYRAARMCGNTHMNTQTHKHTHSLSLVISNTHTHTRALVNL